MTHPEPTLKDELDFRLSLLRLVVSAARQPAETTESAETNQLASFRTLAEVPSH
jgi:hypothetical protein